MLCIQKIQPLLSSLITNKNYVQTAAQIDAATNIAYNYLIDRLAYKIAYHIHNMEKNNA